MLKVGMAVAQVALQDSIILLIGPRGAHTLTMVQICAFPHFKLFNSVQMQSGLTFELVAFIISSGCSTEGSHGSTNSCPHTCTAGKYATAGFSYCNNIEAGQ